MHETNDTVTYKEITGFGGCYRVGDDGSVWTCKIPIGYRQWGPSEHWRPLMPQNKGGYLSVNLSLDGKLYYRAVSALVLEAFIGPRPDGAEACHFPDHSPLNNRLDNLRWGSKVENMGDKDRLGRQPRDATHPNTKVTAEQIVAIREAVAAGEWQRHVAKRFGVTCVCVNRAVTGRTWKDVGGPTHEVGKHTKISASQAAEIRTRRLSGEKLKSLSTEFGVTQTTICEIAKGTARCGHTKEEMEMLAGVPADKSRGIPHGEKCNFAKLTADMVVSIRNRYADGESAVDLAKEFDLTLTGLRYIVVGKNWKRAGGGISVWRNLKKKNQ